MCGLDPRAVPLRGDELRGCWRPIPVGRAVGPDAVPVIDPLGPVFAVPKLLKRNGLKIDDIGLWELNEAFASQAIACIRELEINLDTCNLNGSGISIGYYLPVILAMTLKPTRTTAEPPGASSSAWVWAGTRTGRSPR